MTDYERNADVSKTLTEQWNKGKLPEGDYYIKRRNGYLPYDNIDSHGVWRNSIDEDIVEVLAPVPSYEEWKASEKYNKHLEEVIKIYERKDKQATETSIAYNELEEENAQLKELLRECLAHLTIGKYGTSVTPLNILCDEVEEVLK